MPVIDKIELKYAPQTLDADETERQIQMALIRIAARLQSHGSQKPAALVTNIQFQEESKTRH